MGARILLLLGTKKGAFVMEGDVGRRVWGLAGPYCETWPINHVIGDRESGALYAGGGNAWFGPAVWKSTNLGETWGHSSQGLAYAEGEDPVQAVWSLAPSGGKLYAGVEPAGLFESRDGGENWDEVRGLREHPSRASWQPGGGGLILHAVVPHPRDPDQLWVAISTGGVFYTADGGRSWEARNRGTRADFLPEEQRYPEHGQCVHGLAMAPGEPGLLYQQNHCGMYRSRDGGRRWESIEAGLPSSFGFPVVTHPREPGTLYLVPLNGDIEGRYVPGGAAAVWRSRDTGASWAACREGLPQARTFFGVLRQAMATDTLEPAGVYFGTNTGSLYASSDEGERWTCIARDLPPVYSVETFVVEG